MERPDYFRIIHKYIPPDSPTYPIYLIHCQLVANKALTIAKNLRLSEKKQTFIEEAAMLHDIGIIRTNTPDIFCYGDLPYLCHLSEGRAILEAEGLPRHALVAETHVGVGLTKEQIQEQGLPLPHRDMKPTTIEEEIISFADLFYSKNSEKLWREKPLKKVRENIAKRGKDQLAILDDWIKRFT
ncbi:MAG: HD domain-containing protein [Caldilinea sp. CFX5]|nr:HD domain-containing protein [Caldilinea sp. CFX5]